MPENLAASYVVLVDPMLATGGSAVAALDAAEESRRDEHPHRVHRRGAEGIALVDSNPTRTWRSTRRSIDRGLNAQKYILPGLGDFGDRVVRNGMIVDRQSAIVDRRLEAENW